MKKKSEIASKNRRTEVAGQGTGMSHRTGGSKSTIVANSSKFDKNSDGIVHS